MFKLCFYVPESHLDAVKEALFTAGAGRMGNYDHCCWQTLGTGQFRPLTGSNPFAGAKDEIASEVEYQVEMVCEDHLIDKVIAALKENHPYETPAFSAWRLYNAK